MQENANDLPPHLVEEREALIAEVYRAFEGITREGGVSWSESRVVDDYGTDEQRKEARARDTESRWQDLVDDENWDPDMGVGGWSFLDPIGFRYYLPAVMSRTLRDGYDTGIQFHLTLPRWFLRSHTLETWSALDSQQRLCIQRFVRFMIALETHTGDSISVRGWEKAYRSHWAALPETDEDHKA